MFLPLNAAGESVPVVIAKDWNGSLGQDRTGIHIFQHFVHRATSNGHT